MKKLILSLSFLAFTSTVFASANDDGEIIPANEAAVTSEIVELIRKTVRAGANTEGRAHRDAHRKQHGCVRAEFQVVDSLPEQLAQGIFARPRTYPAWIRFSNGSGQVQDDREGDGRGLAIKILGVDGPKLLDDERNESTQDFLMINHPVFFVRDANEYLKFQQAIMEGALWKWLLNPKRLFHETLIAKEIQSKTMINPLDSSYFSMTASKLGSRQMKFSTSPCRGQVFSSNVDGENRLRENLEATLAATDACFDFNVQLRTHPQSMPVEDPTIEWSQSLSPYVRVARILIPRQQPEQGEFCESLSFTPWHSIEAHRPLGGISRIRRDVYREISTLRHEINGQERREPSLY